MGEHIYTADQLEAGVYNALKARNLAAVVDILVALAGVDIERASKLYDEIQLGLAVAKRIGEAK